MDLKSRIREIRDYPREGINYKDISTLLSDEAAFRQAIQELALLCKNKQAELIVCPKASSLAIGAPLAYVLGTGLVIQNNLDFGYHNSDAVRLAVKPQMKVLVVDYLLATGVTASAVIKQVEDLGGEVVGTVFLVELTGLGGRVKLTDYDTISLVQYNY